MKDSEFLYYIRSLNSPYINPVIITNSTLHHIYGIFVV